MRIVEREGEVGRMPRYDWDYEADVRSMSTRELATMARRLVELDERYGQQLADRRVVDSQDSYNARHSGGRDGDARLDDDAGDDDAATLDDADEDSESLDDLSANDHEPLTIAHSHGDYTTHFHDDDNSHEDAPLRLVNDVDDLYHPGEYEAAFEGMANQGSGDYHHRAGDTQSGRRGTWVAPGLPGRTPPEPWASWQKDGARARATAPANGAELTTLAERWVARRGKRLANLSQKAQMRLFEKISRATGYGRGAELEGEDEPDDFVAEANSLHASARAAARRAGIRLSELSPADRLRFYEVHARRQGYGRDDGGDAA
jgi:hypothetical protein